ncbi:MAG: hypothetical protein LBB09_02415 [Rickettsiales bacterium]|jgi:hypothetical protein|nr:hypothetical protein [Rickettsiales bacterium]
MNEVKVSLGRTKADVPYVDKNHLSVIEKTVKQLNIEYNSINLRLRGVQETILLFFLLFKTQSHIIRIMGGVDLKNQDEFFLKALGDLGEFIHDNEKNREKINEILVAVNIYKKIDLNRISGKIAEQPGDDGKIAREAVEAFTSKIRERVNLLISEISSL